MPTQEPQRPPSRRLLVLRTFFWVFTGDAVSKVAILATSLIAVRSLAPVDFGIYLGLSATMILAASLWDLGVSTVITREVAAERLDGMSAIWQAGSLRLKTLPVWAGTFLVGSVALGHDTNVSGPTFVVFALTSIVFSAHTLTLSLLRARLRFKTAAAAMAIGRWASAAISVLALPSIGLGDPLLVLGAALLVGEALTLLVSIVASVRGEKRAPHFTDEPTRVTLRASLPFAANSVLSLAYNRFDIVILAALSTPVQLGYYAPASRIQDAFYLVPVAVSIIGLPLLSKAWNAGAGVRATRSIMKQLVALGVGLALPTAIVIFVFAPEIISFVLGDEYLGAVTATRILIWSLPFSAVTAVLIAALAATGHALDTTRVFVVAFAVATVLHLSLDWWLGATGAAIASLIREPAALLAGLYYVRRAGLVEWPADREHPGTKA